MNETGGEVWNRTFGGAGENTANAVTRIPGGGDFVVAGSTESSGAGMADVWAVRLNGSGGEVWNRTFGSPRRRCRPGGAQHLRRQPARRRHVHGAAGQHDGRYRRTPHQTHA
ncbi:hypothetical protein [Methanoculleus chikugoensis]|uniref:hypothetical protein n=1 Tax=Methanoculleus chikugoensis TaxID=118126 RepID=UPI001FB407D8|nr:hypothetical protein [Methanoculleus chikugoensis]